MQFHVGFAGYFARRLCESRDHATRVAALLVDRRWPWPPYWVSFGGSKRIVKSTRSRKVVGPKGQAALVDGILNPDYRILEMYRHSQQSENHAHVTVETGQTAIPAASEQPFDVNGQTRGYELPEGADLNAWLELVHELMVVCDVGNAVIPIWPTAAKCLSDISFMRVVVDTPKGDHNLGTGPDFALQNSRANYWRIELGGTYVRHPRWGTYLRRAHLDRIGGLAHVRNAVQPAKVLEFGDLVYLQLTDHPETALTTECEEKRRALEAVMAPIVAPRRPQEPTDASSGVA